MMIDELEKCVLELRNSKGFSFSRKRAEKLVEDYSKFRKKSHLSELRQVVLASLSDGDLKVFEGAPGTGKSKVIHVYSIMALMLRKQVVISGHSLTASQNIAAFIRRLAAGFDINYRGKVKYVKLKELRDIEMNPNTIVLIDEAGFVPLDIMENVVTQAKDGGAMLGLVGDLFQIGLKPEKNGFLKVIKTLYAHNFRTREMKEIFRQRVGLDVKAINDIRKGKIKYALNYYLKRDDYKAMGFYENKKEIIVQLVDDIKNAGTKDFVVIASNYRIQKFLNAELSKEKIKNLKVLLPKEVQGVAFNQAFFVWAQKNIEINEVLVAFSRHKYNMKTYVDSSVGIKNVEELVASIKGTNMEDIKNVRK